MPSNLIIPISFKMVGI